MEPIFDKRREFLISSAALGAGLLLPNFAVSKNDNDKKEDVGPAEDLMREHGALNRILLIYEEGLKRLNTKKDFDVSVLNRSAKIIKDFIENYHEKLEEEFIFPRMRKTGKLSDLVDTLDTQHKAGRKLTALIEQLTLQKTLKSDSDKNKLKKSMESFITMYRPHESREDTVLFPEFHEMLSEKEYDKLGEQFEDREHKLFGKDGFKDIVRQIEEIEKAFDLYDLTQFTPHDV